jgi:3-isopropylmalate dehydrogenase
MKKQIAVLAGDGIGPEVVAQAIKTLKAVEKAFNHKFFLKEALIGSCAIDRTGDPLPPATIDLCMNSDAILFGAIGDPKYDNDPNAKVRPEQGLLKLRKTMGLFSNIRPIKVYDTLLKMSPLKEERIKGVDFVIYRELTGGIYFGKKERTETSASDLCEYAIHEIERIAHQAFQAAQSRRKKLTLVDKANVLESSKLWRDTVKKMAPQYADVILDFLFVDNAAMQIILNPKQFDVILTENMFGDILSDEASVITGSLGLSPSASVGESMAMFEPIHGSAPDIAGKDFANPMATILSTAMMLDYFKLNEEADTVRKAVNALLENGIVTKELNPNQYYSTSTIGDMVADQILEQKSSHVHAANVNFGKSTII